MPRCRCKLEVAICFTHPEWHFITSSWSTNYYAIIVHADFAQWTDFDAIWSARRMGTVLPTPVTDLCAEAVHRSGNVELSLLNSRPKILLTVDWYNSFSPNKLMTAAHCTSVSSAFSSGSYFMWGFFSSSQECLMAYSFPVLVRLVRSSMGGAHDFGLTSVPFPKTFSNVHSAPSPRSTSSKLIPRHARRSPGLQVNTPPFFPSSLARTRRNVMLLMGTSDPDSWEFSSSSSRRRPCPF